MLSLLFITDPIYALEKIGFHIQDNAEKLLKKLFDIDKFPTSWGIKEQIELTGKIPWIKSVKFIEAKNKAQMLAQSQIKPLKEGPKLGGFDFAIEFKRKLIEDTISYVIENYPIKEQLFDDPPRFISLSRPKVTFLREIYRLKLSMDFHLDVYAGGYQRVNGIFDQIVSLKIKLNSEGFPIFAYVDAADFNLNTLGGKPLRDFISKVQANPTNFPHFPQEFLSNPDDYLRQRIYKMLKYQIGEVPLTPIISQLVNNGIPIREFNKKTIKGTYPKEDMLAVVVNFEPTGPHGNIHALNNFLANNDLAIGFHEIFFTYLFNKKWANAPKKYNIDGEIAPDGDYTLENLLMSFRDRHIWVEGSILYGGFASICEVPFDIIIEFEGKLSLWIQERNLNAKLVHIDDSLNWWKEFGSSFLKVFGVCPFLAVARPDMVNWVIDESARSSFREQWNLISETSLAFNLEIPETSYEMLGGFDSLEIRENEMQYNVSIDYLIPEIKEPHNP